MIRRIRTKIIHVILDLTMSINQFPVNIIKFLILISIFLLIYLNLHFLLNFTSRVPNYPNRDLIHSRNQTEVSFINRISNSKYLNLSATKPSDSNQGLKRRSDYIFKHPVENVDTVRNNHAEENDISTILKNIKNSNYEQKIYNSNKFLLNLKPESVIVVQVHKRINYLLLLINSFKKISYIEKSLLIFSHDWFDPEINLIIKNITFAPVLQIFYPHSMQLNPSKFPGDDPNDCPRNMNKNEAIIKKCNNAETPDSFGHYREGKWVQTKHHWFWKINFVFDKLKATQNYNGPILFIEEDHYLAPDSMKTLSLMYNNKNSLCSDCSIFSLGTYNDPLNSFPSNEVSIQYWTSTGFNMGMFFDRTVWNTIKKCSQIWCTYDDYNWDWSLQYISYFCMSSPFKTLYLKRPRIFHMGNCGLHTKKKNCESTSFLQNIEHKFASFSDYFPSSLSVHHSELVTKRSFGKNGGWSDPRDHKLCMSFAK